MSQAQQALRAASDLGAGGETQIVLFASSEGDAFGVRRINPTQEVADRFRALASAWASGLQAKTLVRYAPGRKPDDHEVAFLAVEGVDSIASVLASMSQPIDIELFGDQSFAEDLRFYVVAARLPNPGWVYFFKAKGETIRLKRTRKLVLVPSGAAYDELEADPLVFDPTFDAVVANGQVLIDRQGSFERSLQFVEAARTAARETVDQLLANVALTNADEFAAAASSDINMIAKLRSIAGKMADNPNYVQRMTTARLIQFAEERGLEIDTEEVDGERRFVFYSDPQHRWRILKLLDDDYLHSALTELDYEVNSKSLL